MYLEKIQSPEDLKTFKTAELEALAREIRERLVAVVSTNGGHLASSLGAVEIAIALHAVFNSPRDKIVWDVGHQAYAHKLLTGRSARFASLRLRGGLCGFPKMAESPHDSFGAGHASTAVSAAMGLAAARDARGGTEKIIAVIGDGSLTGGLCYEGLNNAGHKAKNFLVILNDNEMSISRNVGAISAYLNRIITSPAYNRVRSDMQALIKSIPAIGTRMFESARRLEESLKNLVTPGILFEEMGFRYFGPLRGHDIGRLVDMLQRIKNIEQPVILHVLTQKGKGYVHAEQHPEYFHGTSPFEISTGLPKEESPGKSFSDTFGETLADAARADSRVCAITAAMAHGTGLAGFAEEFPGRFFDVGIAEGHAVTFAAGLAAGGCKPVVAVYATFLQRAYDQIVHDVCLQNLPVVFAVDRGGIVGADGATHTGQFAISFLRHIPNLVVMEPANGAELSAMLRCALECGRPAAIVYSKGSADGEGPAGEPEAVAVGRGRVLRAGDDLAIVALGPAVGAAVAAARLLEQRGKSATVIDARFAKPLDEEIIIAAARKMKRLATLEENAIQGGFGSAVLELLAREGVSISPICIGIGDVFVEQGGRGELAKELGLDAESVAERIMEGFFGGSAKGAARGDEAPPSS